MCIYAFAHGNSELIREECVLRKLFSFSEKNCTCKDHMSQKHSQTLV